MSISRTCLVAAVILNYLISGTAGHPAEPTRNCHDEVYRGFDTRLDVSVAGKFPVSNEQPVGFLQFNGKFILGYSHRLLATQTLGNAASLPSFKPIRFLLSTPSEVRLVTSDGLQKFGEHGLETAKVDGFDRDAVMAQDATNSTLLAIQNGARSEFSVWTRRGNRVPLFAIGGNLAKISWTSAGFAAIVSDSLFTFDIGETKVDSTLSDVSFKTATDICMVGPSRVVVMYPNTAVLYAHGLRTILAAVSSGRCAWDNHILYLFDNAQGVVWRVELLNEVGDPETTKEFLQRLSAQAKIKNDPRDRSYRELARFIGIDRASIATGIENPCPTAD
jgi:hypothetical protein